MTAQPLKPSLRIVLLVSLFLFVVGARWAVIDGSGMDLPNWDQWDAEGIHLLAPWYQHRLTLAEVFFPHNEHRAVLTKMVNLGITLANGQWDQRLEAAVNAFLPALIACCLFAFACRHFRGRWLAPAFLLLAALFGLPLAWQNILAGFHSAQFFLIGLSLGAIGLLPAARTGSAAWCLGAICAVAALGSMASGFLAGAIVTGLVGIRLLRRDVSLRASAPTLVLCALLCAIGWFTRVEVSYHEAAKAHSFADFAMTLIRCLQWPATDITAWLACLLWAPWVWLTVRAVSGAREVRSGANLVVVGFGGWVLLQLLATAYLRGSGGYPPPSRYIDTLVVGMVANGLSIPELRQDLGLPSGRRILAALGTAWIVALGAGLSCELHRIDTVELPAVRVNNFYCIENVRNYLATGDEHFLQHKEIPYPWPAELLARIRIPELRAILPASVRVPMKLEPFGAIRGFARYDSRQPERDGGRKPPVFENPAPGMSPATPPLANRVTWGSFGTNAGAAPDNWQGQPIVPSQDGWLKFLVAGQPGLPGATLELLDAATGSPIAEVLPNRLPGDSWRPAYVRIPGRPYVIAARVDSPDRWLAFSEPVTVGKLSYLAWRGVRYGQLLAGIAAGLAVFAGVCAAWGAGREPA
jgi:hypothetical protein